jgi:hypothetical protein
VVYRVEKSSDLNDWSALSSHHQVNLASQLTNSFTDASATGAATFYPP